MSEQQLNVVYLAGGYPTADNPSHGIFNQRAANAIKQHVNLTVIQYRIYKPGRKLYEKIQEDGFVRIILCVPYSPVMEKKMYYINNRLFYFFTLLYARSVIKQADIVHASDGNMGVFASWLKKKYAFKLLTQFIGGDLNQDFIHFYKKNWMRSWKQQLDAVSFNSIALQNRFKELFGNHPKSKVIYRGVDTTKFFSDRSMHEGTVFYFLGGLPNYATFTHGRNTKGGINLLEAWTKIDQEFKSQNIKLLFAGPDSDIDMAKEVKQKLAEPDRLELMGKIDPAAIADFHRKGDVALIPSLEEGLPNVAMEAAATGNLIIANPVGGIPEVIQHNVNGILCKSNDADGLYEEMKWAIEHKESASALGKVAAQMIELNFSSKDFGRKYFDYYKEMTAAV